MRYYYNGPDLETTLKTLVDAGFKRLDVVDPSKIPENSLITIFTMDSKKFDVGIVIGMTGKKTKNSQYFTYWGNNMMGVVKLLPSWEFCQIHQSVFNRTYVKILTEK